ncbi:endoribonuclease L-PSP [Bacillus sp. LL01]|uniref:RidA family protein n=1 Tax=Bacillus sp. LL01 TaxID=1665556 RepID=UPI00064D36CD|nr:RidA family protein [Bacillus sp. LL01]KMJ57164.1 endoribonuclease L-PSP [Bacillus sp. LL01]
MLSKNGPSEQEGIKKDKKISLIHSKSLAPVDYAYASRVPSGMDLLFLAGACPLNKDGKVPDSSNYEHQAKICVENLKEALKECDASLADVVYTRVLVASQNRSDLVIAWEAIRNEFGDHDVPSTLSGVTVLGYQDQLVEIEAVAAVEKLSK